MKDATLREKCDCGGFVGLDRKMSFVLKTSLYRFVKVESAFRSEFDPRHRFNLALVVHNVLERPRTTRGANGNVRAKFQNFRLDQWDQLGRHVEN